MKSLSKLLLVAVLATGTVNYTFAKTAPVAKILQQTTQDRHLSGFNAVDLAGSFDVVIVQGSSESVKVEAPSDVIDRIITEVESGVLRIHSKKNINGDWSFGNNRKMVIYVTAKDLNSIAVTGSGDIFFKEGITTNSLKLKVTGSGDMLGRVTVKSLQSSIAGSGDIKLSGRADESTVSVVGSGDFTARDLITINTAVRVAGSGDAVVNASNKVDAAVTGSGDIHYTGGAKSISTSKAGSGDISRL
ncbi:Putative auto-transporter adhesin, head GIN domain [Mucilaginibacter pineti]|uniref:Putative auto-transporter adhesin, head GIN domain n=1 Tax=Mucilaginibacter pineti TaxID=1391627 RepID=A0A1G7CNQ5_9SPHI|nr:head GIN domain-containing protein [Mucilaginibacter pineti]SDE40410.1 Putative auto-transporter adhesin, head GIN domain [Mucilaginibacter pineti]